MSVLGLIFRIGEKIVDICCIDFISLIGVKKVFF